MAHSRCGVLLLGSVLAAPELWHLEDSAQTLCLGCGRSEVSDDQVDDVPEHVSLGFSPLPRDPHTFSGSTTGP